LNRHPGDKRLMWRLILIRKKGKNLRRIPRRTDFDAPLKEGKRASSSEERGRSKAGFFVPRKQGGEKRLRFVHWSGGKFLVKEHTPERPNCMKKAFLRGLEGKGMAQWFIPTNLEKGESLSL